MLAWAKTRSGPLPFSDPRLDKNWRKKEMASKTSRCPRRVLEQKFAKADMHARPEDLDSYQRCVNCARRVFETLGLQRRAKLVPTLEEYIASKYGTRDSDEDIGRFC